MRTRGGFESNVAQALVLAAPALMTALEDGSSTEKRIETSVDAAGPSARATGTGKPILLAAMVALAACGIGCRQDMHDQPKFIPLRPSDFFADGRSERQLIEGTVARGHLNDDVLYYTGKSADGQFSNEFPFPVTKDVIERGHQRYNIYCTPCHGRIGDGNGMVVSRGYRHPPSYHIDRLRQAPNGYIYDVITNGFGAMPDYAAQIPVEDRWAIVAYERALQLSQHATMDEVPAEERAKLSGGGSQ